MKKKFLKIPNFLLSFLFVEKATKEAQGVSSVCMSMDETCNGDVMRPDIVPNCYQAYVFFENF